MKVYNMESKNGRAVPNQLSIYDAEKNVGYFQSYKSIIIKKDYNDGGKVYLDSDTWDYSTTTGRYRNQWLGENTKIIKSKIKSGEYTLADLNSVPGLF